MYLQRSYEKKSEVAGRICLSNVRIVEKFYQTYELRIMRENRTIEENLTRKKRGADVYNEGGNRQVALRGPKNDGCAGLPSVKGDVNLARGKAERGWTRARLVSTCSICRLECECHRGSLTRGSDSVF